MASMTCAQRVGRGNAPTETCLRQAAAHVAHDLDLFELAWEQRHTRLGWTQWFLSARSLWDFFFEPTRKLVDKKKNQFADDILAADYFPPNEWIRTADGLKNGAPSVFPKIRLTANKLSAHLSYGRLDEARRGSEKPSEEVHCFLLGVAAAWLALLPPKRRVWLGKGLH